MEKGKKRLYLYIGIVVAILLLDQITKLVAISHPGNLIPGILEIAIVENRGGAFGVGQNSTMTFILTNIIVIGIIIRFMMVRKEEMDIKTGIALCFIIAGGLGNVIDRIFRGYVVDFLNFSQLIPFPTFNLADVFIVVGILLLIIFFGIYTYQKKKTKKQDKKIEENA